MTAPTPRELLRRTGITLLGVLALATPMYVAVVTRGIRLGGLTRGDFVPWYSQWDPRFTLWTLVTVGAALSVVALLPALLRVGARRFGFLLFGLAVTTWAATASSDGPKVGEARTGLIPTTALAYPFERTAHEYIGDVPKVDRLGPRGLLRGWHTEDVRATMAWHSRTHPPGAVLLLAGVAALLGSGALQAALAVILLGGLAPLLAWRWARFHLDDAAARMAALLFALAPGTTLFFATSMEAVFVPLQLTALWAMTAGLRADGGPARWGWSVAGGAALALATFFSYASILVVFVVGALEGVRLLRREPDTPGLIGTAGLLGIQMVGFFGGMGVLAALGWNPVASVQAAIGADAAVMPEIGGVVGWASTGVANLMAWGVGAGLATLGVAGGVVAAARARRAQGDVARLPTPLLAVAIALLLAAFSTLFTLEVERIWIMMTLPLLVGAFAAIERPSIPLLRLWAALLLAQSIITEVLLETRW